MKHVNGPSCPSCTAKVETCHVDLQKALQAARQVFYDLHVAWGYRGEGEQNDAYARGASRLKWPHSLHNKLPSLAMDLFQIDADGVARWQRPYFKRVNDWFVANGYALNWGGSWPRFPDCPHWQLKNEEGNG